MAVRKIPEKPAAHRVLKPVKRFHSSRSKPKCDFHVVPPHQTSIRTRYGLHYPKYEVQLDVQAALENKWS
jgi:hypothetical protein